MGKLFRGLGYIATTLILSASAANACNRPVMAGTDRAIPASSKISQSLLNKAILIEVNYTRCRAGLPALKSKSSLTRAATKHSKWMAKYSQLSHNSNISSQATPHIRMKSRGLKFKTGSENISKMYRYQLAGRQFYTQDAAACQFSDTKGRAIPPHSYASLARQAVKLWADSPKHRKNLMDSRMRLTSTAAAYDRKGSHCGALYLTQDFLG